MTRSTAAIFVAFALSTSLPAAAQAPSPPQAEVPSVPTSGAPPVQAAGVLSASPALFPLRLDHRLVLVTLHQGFFSSGLWLLQGGSLLNDSATADGLADQLSASPTAASLARRAHDDLQLGNTLVYVSLGVLVASCVTVGVGAGQPSNSTAQNALSAVGVGGLLAGIVLEIVGAVHSASGLAHLLDAVNAYNLDLVRGRLESPALPPR